MRLLNTRPKEDASALTFALESMGHEVLSSPLLTIEDLPAVLPDLSGMAGLVATSANGVRAFARQSSKRDLKVYAVGDATARVADDEGFFNIASATGDVAALSALIKAECQPGDGVLLHVAGTSVAGDLGGDLAAAGYDVQRVVLYQAVLAKSLSSFIKKMLAGKILAGHGLDGVLLYSPRTAMVFKDLVGAAGLEKACAKADVWCLSPAVADKIRDLGWRQIHISRRPEQSALLELIAEFTTQQHPPESQHE